MQPHILTLFVSPQPASIIAANIHIKFFIIQCFFNNYSYYLYRS